MPPFEARPGNLFTVGPGHGKLSFGHCGCHFFFGGKGIWRSSIQYGVTLSNTTYWTPAGPWAVAYDEATARECPAWC